MNVMLGNLTLEQIESRIGVEIPEETRQHMMESHQQSATNIAPGKWHCFDMPFMLVFGSMDDARKFHDGVKHLSGQMKQPLQIGVQP